LAGHCHQARASSPTNPILAKGHGKLMPTGHGRDTERLWMWLGGAVVFLTGISIRLLLIKDARFTGDESYFFQVAQDIAHGRAFPLLGPALTGGGAKHPGAAFFYLMSLSQFLSQAPEMANAWVATLGAFSAVLVFLAWISPFGPRASFIGAMFLAASPWSVLFSDRIWNSNVFPFLVALGFFAAMRIRSGGPTRWWMVVIPTCAVMPQFHMSAPVVWCALAVLLIPRLRHAPRRALAVGLALSVALYLPYLVSELQTGFGNLRGFFGELPDGAGRARKGFLLAPLYALRFLTLDVTYHRLTGYWGGLDEARAMKSVLSSGWQVFSSFPAFALWLSLITVPALAAIAIFKKSPEDLAAKGGDLRRALVLCAAVALLADMVFLALSGKRVFAHYVHPILPFVFVLFPAALWRVRWRPPTATVALGVFLIFAAASIQAVVDINQNVDARHGIRVKRAVLDHIYALRQAEGARRGDGVALSFSYHAGHHYSYSILAHRALGRRLHFDPKAKNWRFRIQLAGEKAPGGLRGDGTPFSFGPLVVYRLSETR
jgi:hypothetical protein